jgi:UDP-N-acetylmuramate dehydrogenase
MQIKKNQSLKSYNTFGLDVNADLFLDVFSVNEVRLVLSQDEFRHRNHMFLGGGSNVLFTTNYEGLIIHNCLKGIDVISENSEHVFVKVASGVIWHDFVLFAIQNNWGGVENLSLIPGSVGAGPMQNIGAYGVELKDTFHELEALHLGTMELKTFSKEECKFGYRESVFKNTFKNQYFISSVTFKLNKNPILNTSYGAISIELGKLGITNPTIKEVSDAVIRIRQSKLPDPKVLGNSGSFFKNPEIEEDQFESLKAEFPTIVGYPTTPGKVKLAAGWLIEQCGWKGKVVGHCGSHKDQALVLVNYGGARGKEIYELALTIRQSVKDRFGVYIEPEVNII